MTGDSNQYESDTAIPGSIPSSVKKAGEAANNGRYYECPICGTQKPTDDRIGHHLVTSHWNTIVDAFTEDSEMAQNPYTHPSDKPTNPTKHSRDELPQHTNWHETARLPDGTRVGQLGAMWHILDEDGWAISRGYHEIERAGEGYRGKLGGKREYIELRGEPDQ